MQAYEHGGNARDIRKRFPGCAFTDFSSNVNPLGVPEPVLDAIHAAVREINEYPDPRSESLKSALAEYEGVDASAIAVGNGASDMIFRLSFGLKPKTALLVAPCFSEYEKSLKAADCKIEKCLLDASDGFRLGGSFIERLKSLRPEIAFICNPNNPTGSLAEPMFIESCVQTAEETQTALIVDECYLDLVAGGEAHSAKAFLSSPHLVVLKALTKSFSLPGLRIGYILASGEALHEKLESVSQSWPVSSLAQAAGEAILSCTGSLETARAHISTERLALAKGLESMGFKVFPSDANFLLFYASPDADLYSKLLRKGFIIRDCSNFEGLGAGYYRICVGTAKDNERLLLALREVISE